MIPNFLLRYLIIIIHYYCLYKYTANFGNKIILIKQQYSKNILIYTSIYRLPPLVHRWFPN